MAFARSTPAPARPRRIPLRDRSPRWFAAALLLVAAGATCRPGPAGGVSDEDRFLEELMETYVDERLRFYPVESTLSGLPGQDDRLGRFSRDAIEARSRWLVDFHQRIVGIRGTELSKPAYLDALWLTALVKSESFELDRRRLWARTASFYAETLRLGLVSLLLRGEPGDGLPAVLERLRGVRDLVAEALANLEPAAGPFRDDGLRSLAHVRRLVASLPVTLDGRLAPPSMEALRRASLEAELALGELENHVRHGGGGIEEAASAPWGEEALSTFWLHRDMIDLSLEELAERAEERLVAIENEITALGLREFPGRSREELFATQPAEGEPVALVRSSLDALQARLSAGPRGATIDLPPVRGVPSSYLSSERLRLWLPARLEPATLLVVGLDEPVPSGSQPSPATGWSAPRLDARDVDLLSLQEGVARARLHRYQSSARSLLRRLFSAESTTRGWLRLHVATLVEQGALGSDPDPERELRARHRSLLEWLRLAAVLRFHAGGETLEDVEARFLRRGHLSPADAHLEAVRVAVDPATASAALGELLLSDLAGDFRREFPFAAGAALDDELLSEGVLPVRLIRFHLLDPALGERSSF